MSFTQTKFDKLKENLNFISIGLMIIVQVLFSLLTIEDGNISFNTPETLSAWLFWIGQLFITTIIGVSILGFFRRQGIYLGHKKIKDIHDEYLLKLNKNAKTKKPRSLKEYYAKEGTKDTISKMILFVIVTLVTGSLLISPNWNNILSLVTNIVLSIGFGIKTMLSAENFVTEELSVWYKKEIINMEENENDKRKGRLRGTRHAESSGIQPQEECSTGQSDKNASGKPEQTD